jgi:hypothetical protein
MNPSAPSGKPDAETLQLAFLYTSCIESDSRFQSSGSSCTMQRESIQMYWNPRFTVAKRASWNVFDRLSTGSDDSNELRFARVVVKNLVLPQQWERVRYGVPVGSVSPRHIFAITLEFSPVCWTHTSLVGSLLPFVDNWHSTCSERHSSTHRLAKGNVPLDLVDVCNFARIVFGHRSEFI